MPAAMSVTLFLLLFGGVWTQEVTPEPQDITITLEESVPGGSSFSLVSTVSEAENLNLVTPNPMTTEVPEKGNSTTHQLSPPLSDLHATREASFSEASTAATGDLHVSEPAVFQEVSTRESSNLEINANSNPAEPRNSLALHVMTNGTMAPGSPETTGVDGGPPVTTATSSPQTTGVDGGPPVTMATSSPQTTGVDGGPLVTTAGGSPETTGVDGGPPVTTAAGFPETTGVDRGPPVTTATGSLETPDVEDGPPVTMATGSLETPDVEDGPPVTMATDSLETLHVDVGPPVTTATGSLPIPKGTGGSPISTVKILTGTTSASSKNTSSPRLSDQGTKGTLLVALLGALLVVIVLVALFLLWRQRQKRRTGALTLNGGGKRNGALDAWAGPARVPDEEALTAPSGGSGDEKGPAGSEREGAGPLPTLTTFFERRKSQQCSLELGELEAGSAPLLKGEEEPLVGPQDDEASEGPEAREVEAPSGL